MDILEIRNYNNKLSCDVFSFIDLWDETTYYEGKEIKIYDCSGPLIKFKGKGRLEIVSKFRLHQLKASAAMLDFGYPLNEVIRILKETHYKKIPNLEKASFAYIIIRKIKEQHTQQNLGL